MKKEARNIVYIYSFLLYDNTIVDLFARICLKFKISIWRSIDFYEKNAFLYSIKVT